MTDDVYSLAQGASITVTASNGVLANDDANAVKAVLVPNGGVQHGNLTLNADGGFTYTHNGGATLTDSFNYVVEDAAGSQSSSVGTVTLHIQITNGAPVAAADSYVIESDGGANGVLGSYSVTAGQGVLANDSDPDNDPLTATLIGNVTSPRGKGVGTVTLNSDGSFTFFSTRQSYVGEMQFTYMASDGVNTSGRGVVKLNRPIAVKKNIFRSKPGNALRGRPDRHRWKIAGGSSAPQGSTVSIYLGSDTSAQGKLVGTTTVDANGSWAFVNSAFPVDPNAPFVSPWDTASGTTATTFSVVVNAGTGAVDQLIDVPLQLRGVLPRP